MRRPHLGGSLGAALLQTALKRKWVTQDLDSRALALTAVGRKEAQAAARLSHPAIVKILDWGEDQGQPFFAMEFIEGADLGDTTRGGRRLCGFRTKTAGNRTRGTGHGTHGI